MNGTGPMNRYHPAVRCTLHGAERMFGPSGGIVPPDTTTTRDAGGTQTTTDRGPIVTNSPAERGHHSPPRLETGAYHYSTDLDTARHIVGRSMCPHQLTLAGHAKQLDARIRTHRLGAVSFNDISYGGDVDIIPGELSTFIVIQLPMSGQGLIRCGHQEIHTRPGHASVVTPTRPLSMRWSGDCEQLVVRYERYGVEAHLRDLLGEPLSGPIAFDLGLDVTTGPGRTLLDSVNGAVAALNRNDNMLDHALAIDNLEQNLLTNPLLAAHNNYTPQLTGVAPATSSRIVKAVVDTIESHPEWRHTTRSLAREHGISVRTLERSFRRDLDTTPAAYLRTVRLCRVHDMLHASGPDTVTVQQVAHAWGFTHLGRFARDYHKLFGELPSYTRQR